MLTGSKIRAAKPLAKSYKLTDAQGLYLTVSASGSKLWYFRYRFGGKENRLAFGPYPQVTLAALYLYLAFSLLLAQSPEKIP